MKFFKNIFSILFVMIFALVVVGCKNNDDDNNGDGENKEVTYTVTFNTDGGNTIESQTVKEGEKAVKPENPIKEGFSFVDWYNGEIVFDFETPITANIELKATWEENEEPGPSIFTVTFNTDGGTAIDSQMVEQGGYAAEPETPTKEGYTFLGWFYRDLEWDFAGFTVEFDLEITAKWSKDSESFVPQEFTVTFDSDGGSVVENQIVLEKEKVIKPADPVKEGYNFAGWYMGETLWDFDLYTASKNMTLVAHWTEKVVLPPAPTTYTVTFNSDGGSTVRNKVVNEGTKVTAPTDPTKTGFSFVGWYLGEELFDFETPITENITLIAKWEEVYYTVTFNTDGAGEIQSQSVRGGLTATKPQDPVKEGFKFAGWYLGVDLYDFNNAVSGSIELTAKWTPITYTVTFDSDGGTSVATQTISYNGVITKPEDPTKEGYDFTGWYLENTKWNFETIVTGNITLTARWVMHEDEAEELVTEVYITLNTKTYAYSSSSSKYEASMKTPDWVNIVIYVTLVEGYTYSEDVVLYVNNVKAVASTYTVDVENGKITYVIDDPNWSNPF